MAQGKDKKGGRGIKRKGDEPIRDTKSRCGESKGEIRKSGKMKVSDKYSKRQKRGYNGNNESDSMSLYYAECHSLLNKIENPLDLLKNPNNIEANIHSNLVWENVLTNKINTDRVCGREISTIRGISFVAPRNKRLVGYRELVPVLRREIVCQFTMQIVGA